MNTQKGKYSQNHYGRKSQKALNGTDEEDN